MEWIPYTQSFSGKERKIPKERGVSFNFRRRFGAHADTPILRLETMSQLNMKSEWEL